MLRETGVTGDLAAALDGVIDVCVVHDDRHRIHRGGERHEVGAGGAVIKLHRIAGVEGGGEAGGALNPVDGGADVPI